MKRSVSEVADLICICIARQVRDGEVVAQGLATPLVAAGYLLAWKTHAPNLHFASAIGQSVSRTGAPLALGRIESLWLDRSLKQFGFARAAAELLPRIRPMEFFRPGQVDLHGNFNNLAFGSDPRRPRLRLPGSGGIPDVTPVFSDIHLYVPRHSPVTFVNEIDYKSGLGHDPARRYGEGPKYLVSDLGQFDFVDGKMRLTHLHPGVDIDHVVKRTGFEFERAAKIGTSRPPTEDERRILKDEVDPLGIRTLELYSGRARRQELQRILEEEARLPERVL